MSDEQRSIDELIAASSVSERDTKELIKLAGYASAEWEPDPDTEGGYVLAVAGDSTESRAACVQALKAVGLAVSTSRDQEGGVWIWAVRS